MSSSLSFLLTISDGCYRTDLLPPDLYILNPEDRLPLALMCVATEKILRLSNRLMEQYNRWGSIVFAIDNEIKDAPRPLASPHAVFLDFRERLRVVRQRGGSITPLINKFSADNQCRFKCLSATEVLIGSFFPGIKKKRIAAVDEESMQVDLKEVGLSEDPIEKRSQSVVLMFKRSGVDWTTDSVSLSPPIPLDRVGDEPWVLQRSEGESQLKIEEELYPIRSLSEFPEFKHLAPQPVRRQGPEVQLGRVEMRPEAQAWRSRRVSAFKAFSREGD